MALTLSMLYRGPLSSCNYDCNYCPFAKREESSSELATDRAALERFVAWIAARASTDRLRILFTPWGEGLTRKWYQQALVQLGSLPMVSKVAIQTNLSAGLQWLYGQDTSKIALWATYHPSQVTREQFLKRCAELTHLGVAHSVGIVGTREHFAEIEAMRTALPPSTYLWVNAYKDVPNYYEPTEIEWLNQIDPIFPVNNTRHPSLGQECDTGHTVVSIDGEGNIRRCHFVKEILGNIYHDEITEVLKPRLCPNQTCGCYIGYVHQPKLNQQVIFGERLLERIPLYVSTSG